LDDTFCLASAHLEHILQDTHLLLAKYFLPQHHQLQLSMAGLAYTRVSKDEKCA